jgi:hypothetical protein
MFGRRARCEWLDLPVALSAAILLGLLGIGINMTVFSEVLGKDVLRRLVLVVAVGAVTEFVGASHC